jgi:3-methyladenine DNA glycosylase/8-oxoguanine DNA glycosylase
MPFEPRVPDGDYFNTLARAIVYQQLAGRAAAAIHGRFLALYDGTPTPEMDIWPVDDFGVRKGYARLHGLTDLPKPKELAAAGEIYRPYRSVAAWYCWRAVDAVLPD